ncbi:MAG: hypothetical protein Q8P15_00540 [Nanoarchaeota archaeon]|nr:hypothetical protein [Nanoarchaeota archaeon]
MNAKCKKPGIIERIEIRLVDPGKSRNYVLPELAEEGFRLSWNMNGSILDTPLNKLWDKIDGKYNLFHVSRFWMSDKNLGEIKSIFHHEGGNQLYLDYAPKLLRWGCSEELGRRNIALRQGEDEKDLRLPFGFYLLKNFS